MLTEQEQAFIQGIELSKDMNLEIPEEDLKRYYDILQKEYSNTESKGMKRINEMDKLRKQGYTYQEIAQHYGISKQRVFQLLGKIDSTRFKEITKEQCIYDGLREWLNENRISRASLCRKLNNGVYQSATLGRLKKILKGANVSMFQINRILALTGLTYEDAFLRGNNDAK